MNATWVAIGIALIGLLYMNKQSLDDLRSWVNKIDVKVDKITDKLIDRK